MNEKTIERLASAIAAATFELDDVGRATARATWGLLTEGRPATIEAIAAKAALAPRAVSTRLDTWPGVFKDGDGNVVGFAGLALSGMAHSFEAEGGARIFAWCALDPMLIVPILGRPARIAARHNRLA